MRFSATKEINMNTPEQLPVSSQNDSISFTQKTFLVSSTHLDRDNEELTLVSNAGEQFYCYQSETLENLGIVCDQLITIDGTLSIEQANKTISVSKIYPQNLPNILSYFGLTATSENDSHNDNFYKHIRNLEGPRFEEVRAFFDQLIDNLGFDEFTPVTVIHDSDASRVKNVVNCVSRIQFKSDVQRQLALNGAFLFCICKAYKATLLNPKIRSELDFTIIRNLTLFLKKIESDNPELSSIIRPFLHAGMDIENKVIKSQSLVHLIQCLYVFYGK